MPHYLFAKRIGILFDATLPENVVSVNRYAELLKRENKEVTLLGYIDAKKNFGQPAFNFISKKDVNWIFKPRDQKVMKFINEDFDVLVNAWFAEYYPLQFISTLSKAGLRVGAFEEAKLDLSLIHI